jgi:tetratricopeptide (TPR) repeat protein
MTVSENDSATTPPDTLEVKYEFTPMLPQILGHLKSSLMVTTYQAGKLLVLGVHDGKLKISFNSYEQPMGLAIKGHRMALGTRRHIHYFEGNTAVAASVEPRGTFDVCYIPQDARSTGSIHGHDLAWGDDGLWVVNTLFSCLCSLHADYNFVPRWQPKFISQLIDQDRCHLNGLAVVRRRAAVCHGNVRNGYRCGLAAHKSNIRSADRHPHERNHRAWVRNAAFATLVQWHAVGARFRLRIIVHRRSGIGEEDDGCHVPRIHAGAEFCRTVRICRPLTYPRNIRVWWRSDCRTSRPVEMRYWRRGHHFRPHSCRVSVLSGVTEIFAVEVAGRSSCPLVAGASSDGTERDVWIVPAPGKTPRPTAALPWYASGAMKSAAAVPQLTTANEDPRAQDLETWLATHPDDAASWITLGNLRQEQSRQHDALRCYEHAAAADKTSIPARQNLGYVQFNLGMPEQARDTYRELVAMSPTGMNRLLESCVLPVIYDSHDQLEQWRQCQRQALEQMADDGVTIDGGTQQAPTAFFWAYQGRNDVDIMQLRGRIIHGDTDFQPPTSRRSDGRLRVGFLSAYLRDHTIGRLNIGRIEQLDRSRFHVTVCLATNARDTFTRRLRAAADRTIDVPRDVKAAIAAIRAADLEILLFCDVGMDALCSTLAYSRLAPIQCVTWGTSGHHRQRSDGLFSVQRTA